MAKLATLAVLLGIVVAGCGGGTPSPRAEVSSFVVSYVDQDRDNCCELGMKATVDHVTFARSDRRWAVVAIAVTASNGAPDGRDYLVVRKAGSTWKVLAFGKGELGCFVPRRLRTEFAAGVPSDVLRCTR